MEHAWKESYSADLEHVRFTCTRCKRYMVVAKRDCDFLTPPDEELEKSHINPDCDVEQVRHVMKS